MSFRERLANWISGGELAAAKIQADYWRKIQKESVDKYHDRWNKEVSAKRTLKDIVGMETPGANATVRRMAAAARKGLNQT